MSGPMPQVSSTTKHRGRLDRYSPPWRRQPETSQVPPRRRRSWRNSGAWCCHCHDDSPPAVGEAAALPG